MIEKIESRREELVAAHGKTKEEIAQLEQRLGITAQQFASNCRCSCCVKRITSSDL